MLLVTCRQLHANMLTIDAHMNTTDAHMHATACSQAHNCMPKSTQLLYMRTCPQLMLTCTQLQSQMHATIACSLFTCSQLHACGLTCTQSNADMLSAAWYWSHARSYMLTCPQLMLTSTQLNAQMHATTVHAHMPTKACSHAHN